MKTKLLGFTKSRWAVGLAGILIGALIILGARFVTYKSADVHYHANFALYLKGQREMFQGARYYSEAEMCLGDQQEVPAERAHMHDNVNDVVHVEDQAVTWGQFFQNLGWGFGDNYLVTPDGTAYTENGADKVNIMLNGQDYTGLGSIANRVIGDADRLLVSYGNLGQADLQKEYNAIPATARHYDVTPDPAACSGGQHDTMRDRMRHLF